MHSPAKPGGAEPVVGSVSLTVGSRMCPTKMGLPSSFWNLPWKCLYRDSIANVLKRIVLGSEWTYMI